jgi:hypothetical protein
MAVQLKNVCGEVYMKECNNANGLMRIVTLSLVGISLIASFNCKSPEEESLAQIDVSNECGVAIDVFMDGVFQFALDYLGVDTIPDVTLGIHDFMATKKDTDFVVVSESFDIYSGGDLVWTITSPATIKVTNASGQTVSIYANAEYQVDLDDQENITFEDVLYGEYQFDAVRTIDSRLVDSKYINVVENKEYIWLISN